MHENNFNGLTVLITGATGFIGQNLLCKLVDIRANVIAVAHNNQPNNNSVDRIVYDGTYESLFKPLEEIKIDIVIHLATLFIANHQPSQIGGLIDSNVKFGSYMLELTRQKNIPYFINTTTYAQAYNHKGYNPQNLYAATKQCFETIVKYYEETTDTVFVTLELTDTYGRNDTRPKFINLLLNAIEDKNTFKMSLGEQEISYLNIEDAVNAYITTIHLLLSKKITNNSKFSVYSEEILKLKDLVTLVCSKLNSSIEINRGFYSYRNREIMTFKPSYIKLPDWNAEISVAEGILKMIIST